MAILSGIFHEIVLMFMEMSPYIILGLFFVGILNVFFTKDLIVRHVGRNNIWSVLKSALFGVPLPLCSCGVIPAAVYMNRNGASKGATVSFLISTPQTGVDSIIATYGMLGPVFAVFRPVAAFVMGVIGGIAVRIFDRTPDESALQGKPVVIAELEETRSMRISQPGPISRLVSMLRYAFIEFLDDIALQFVAGIIISGCIAYLIPDDFFTSTALHKGLPGMLLMVAVGIPMYVCATASIPVAVALMMKGFSPGVAYVFLVTGPATNAASLTIILNALGKKITGLYLGTLIACSIAFGYALDALFPALGALPMDSMHHVHGGSLILTPQVQTALSILFLLLLTRSILAKYFFKKKSAAAAPAKGVTVFSVQGMTCKHCAANVKNAILSVPGVEKADVDLAGKSASVQGTFSPDAVVDAVGKAGYKADRIP